ncbi:MAG TPA: MFS transporter [Aggregatilineales bacterium]|nr:MFS transporter [Anaerolineales bacterium]HRE47829.1 MFS transporter [Aggregatilineales bacterium]
MHRLRGLFAGMDRRMLLFLLHTALLQLAVYGITDVILNFYFVSLGYGSDTIGILQGLGRVGGTITGIPLGIVADRMGARRLTILCALGVGASYLPLIFLPTLPMLVLSRFLFGAFFNAMFLAGVPLIAQLVEARYRTRAFATYQIVGLTGTSFGTALGGFLPSIVARLFPTVVQSATLPPEQTIFAYAGALFAAGLFSALSVLPLLLFAEPETAAQTRAIQKAKTGEDQPRTFTRTNLWRMTYLSLPMITFGITAGMTFPFYNLFLRTRFHQSDEVVGTLLGVAWLIMGASSVLTPLWDKRFGRVRAALILMGMAAVAFFVMSGAAVLAVGVIALYFAVSLRNMIVPLYQPLFIESFPPSMRNIASGLNSVLWNGGWFLSSAVSGALLRNHGFGLLYALVGVGVATTGISIYLIFRNRPTNVSLEMG